MPWSELTGVGSWTLAKFSTPRAFYIFSHTGCRLSPPVAVSKSSFFTIKMHKPYILYTWKSKKILWGGDTAPLQISSLVRKKTPTPSLLTPHLFMAGSPPLKLRPNSAIKSLIMNSHCGLSGSQLIVYRTGNESTFWSLPRRPMFCLEPESDRLPPIGRTVSGDAVLPVTTSRYPPDSVFSNTRTRLAELTRDDDVMARDGRFASSLPTHRSDLT